ncbi:MAG: formate/nitrite transporter family protein [Acidimicrobiales bacterium]
MTTLIAGRATPRSLVRLWLGTFAANVAGGTILVALVVIALPGVHPVARQLGSVTPLLGINARSFAAAMLGGVLLTLFTWVERSTTNVPAKLVAAMSTGFLVVAAPLNHSVVGSLEMAGGLLVGDAGYGPADAAGAVGWAALGNSVGGLLLVTVLRLVQVGHRRILEERLDTPPHEHAGNSAHDADGEHSPAVRQR